MGQADPTPAPTGTFVSIPLAELHPSPTNPRKIFDPDYLAELAGSIRQHGLLQAVWVRTRPAGGHELIFGECRTRGARLAGLTEIRAEVHDEYTDAQIAILQGEENSKRKDVHPLEEADGLKNMTTIGGLSVAEVAAKITKPPAYVYARLRLCNLAPEPRRLFLANKIPPTLAELIARLESHEEQTRFTKAVFAHGTEGDPAPYRRALEIQQTQFTRRLDRAPFDVKDPDLLPQAGACTACPKRSGAKPDRETFGGRTDTCLDGACYRGKCAATFERVKAAPPPNAEIVTKAKAKDLFYPDADRVRWESGFVSLDDVNALDAKGRTFGFCNFKSHDDAVKAIDALRRQRRHRLGEPDPLLRLHALPAREGPAHGRGDRKHRKSHGWGPGRFYEIISFHERKKMIY
jgi:ParB/RepB/Spo0J family partition protein